MQKLDFKKDLQNLYRPPASKVVQVEVPPTNFLMIDGKGDPNTAPEYAAAVEVLFAVSYAIKFAVKKGALAIDYGVMPLQGLWWADDMRAFATGDKSNWSWTMMIAQPPFVTKAMVDEAIASVRRKKDPEPVPKIRFEAYTEGKCAQIMHIGPFSEEGPNIEKVRQFIEFCGRRRRGKHHEIYLSDIRRTDPAKWKTVIRQAMD